MSLEPRKPSLDKLAAVSILASDSSFGTSTEKESAVEQKKSINNFVVKVELHF